MSEETEERKVEITEITIEDAAVEATEDTVIELQEEAPRKKLNPINKSFVYLHSYAGCRVYESLYNQVAIQRRIEDSYMNASAILKAAKVPKSRRVKILAKLVKLVPFEKITEGFHAYQGVYVPLKAARDLASRWEVLEQLRPLFEKV